MLLFKPKFSLLFIMGVEKTGFTSRIFNAGFWADKFGDYLDFLTLFTGFHLWIHDIYATEHTIDKNSRKY